MVSVVKKIFVVLLSFLGLFFAPVGGFTAEAQTPCGNVHVIDCARAHPNKELQSLFEKHTYRLFNEYGLDERFRFTESAALKFALAEYNSQFGTSDEWTAEENRTVERLLLASAGYDIAKFMFNEALIVQKKKIMDEMGFREDALHNLLGSFASSHVVLAHHEQAFNAYLKFLFVVDVKRNCFLFDEIPLIMFKRHCSQALREYGDTVFDLRTNELKLAVEQIVWKTLENNGRWAY